MMDIFGLPNEDRTDIINEIDNDDGQEKHVGGRKGRKFPVQWILDHAYIPYNSPVVADGKKVIDEFIIGQDNYTRKVVPLTAEDIENAIESKRQFMVVTPWQFRKALNQLGLRGQVTAFLATADQDTKDGWEVASSFDRLHPMIDGMKDRFNMADEDMDNLFILASSL